MRGAWYRHFGTIATANNQEEPSLSKQSGKGFVLCAFDEMFR